jgi:LmbE family N-acetylglucosaminyl deacetylase
MKKTALVIVAHPDDETIWMGGTILKNNFDWTIFSLCRKSDLDRAPKFKKVCNFYNAKSIITDVEDDKLSPIKTQEIISIIEKNLKQKKFGFIFTHGKGGEYGHQRHTEIHNAIMAITKQNILIGKFLYTFAYKLSDKLVPSTSMRIAIPKSSDMNVLLTKKEHEQKQKIINELYGFNKNSFEYLCSNKKESFKLVK